MTLMAETICELFQFNLSFNYKWLWKIIDSELKKLQKTRFILVNIYKDKIN